MTPNLLEMTWAQIITGIWKGKICYVTRILENNKEPYQVLFQHNGVLQAPYVASNALIPMGHVEILTHIGELDDKIYKMHQLLNDVRKEIVNE